MNSTDNAENDIIVKCPVCRHKNKDGERVCKNCGIYLRPDKVYMGIDKNSYPETASGVRIPGYIGKIDERAFINREALKTVCIDGGSHLEAIGNSAFSESGVSSIRIQNSVKRIGAFAFSVCESLKEVIIEPGSILEKIEESVFMCSAIESITIPKSVESIGDFAFFGCHSLKEIHFENGSRLKTIGSLAFAQSGIESIELPESVECIAHDAFRRTALEDSMKLIVALLNKKVQ